MTKRVLISSVVCCLLCWPLGAAHSFRPLPQVIPGASSDELTFEGMLICYRCDIPSERRRLGKCEKDAHLSLLKLADGHTYRLYGSSHFISAKLSSEKFHGKKVRLEGVYDSATNWLHVHRANLTGDESPSRGFTGKE